MYLNINLSNNNSIIIKLVMGHIGGEVAVMGDQAVVTSTP